MTVIKLSHAKVKDRLKSLFDDIVDKRKATNIQPAKVAKPHTSKDEFECRCICDCVVSNCNCDCNCDDPRCDGPYH